MFYCAVFFGVVGVEAMETFVVVLVVVVGAMKTFVVVLVGAMTLVLME